MERDGCMGEGIGDVVRGVGVWGAASLQRGIPTQQIIFPGHVKHEIT